MDGEAVYYGLNALSHNVIMANRKKLKNPNGLFLGVPGSGKSFSGLVFAPQVNFRQAGLLHLLPTRFASNSFVAEVKSSLLFPMFITSSNQNIDFIIS